MVRQPDDSYLCLFFSEGKSLRAGVLGCCKFAPDFSRVGRRVIGFAVRSTSQVMPPLGNFAGHNLYFDTKRLRLRPFEEADFDIALPFYKDPDFLNAMEGKPPDEPVNGDYLRRAGKVLAKLGFLFAIVEKRSGRAIGEVCLQWMNLERAKIANEKVMRMPIGIWDKSMWGFEITRVKYESLHQATPS